MKETSIKQSRVKKCEKAWVEVKGSVAFIRTEDNAYALVPIDVVCKLAKRFNLCYENYECRE